MREKEKNGGREGGKETDGEELQMSMKKATLIKIILEKTQERTVYKIGSQSWKYTQAW